MRWRRKPRCKECRVPCDWMASEDGKHFTTICPCCRELMWEYYPERRSTTFTDRPSEPQWFSTAVI